MIYFFSFLSAVIGGFLIVFYYAYVSKRQEKALMLLLSQDVVTLFDRCSMYYDQMLRGPVSFSTLFQISDSVTFTKFAEVTRNLEMIERLMDLKAWFFQVIRYADKCSDALAVGNDNRARLYQRMAMNFFMGDRSKSGTFDRYRYKSYVEHISSILDYLEKLNSPGCFQALLIHLVPAEKQGALAVDQFIRKKRKNLEARVKELEDNRRKEKKKFDREK